MRNPTLIAALILACAALAPRASGDEDGAAALRWNLVPGETLRYRVRTDQTAHQTIGSHGFDTKQMLDVTYALTPQERLPDGSVRVRCRYERVVLDLDQMVVGQLQWDSARPEDQARDEEPLVRPWAQLVRRTFEFRLRPDGSVPLAGIEGYQKIREAVLAPIADQPLALRAYAPAFSDGAVRALLERSYAVLPPKPVGIGGGWSRSVLQPIPLLGLLRFDRRFRLDSVTGTAGVLITFDTLLTRQSTAGLAALTKQSWIPLPWGLLEGQRGPIEATLTSAAERGELRFDRARGLLLSARAEADLTVTTRLVPPDAPERGPGARSATAVMKQVMTVELLP